ncbi:MAG: CHAD domain-containing protein, partial [Anaerolineales bacterium]
MEVEAKFKVPDAEVFSQLQVVTQLEHFDLGAPQSFTVEDTYLDTEKRHLWRGGYALRRRLEGRGILMTLKALGGGTRPIWHREELEILLLNEKPPVYWPTSEIRSRLLDLTEGASLDPLFSLRQKRIVRPILEERRRIAILSLDEVSMVQRSQRERFLALELELVTEGAEGALERLVTLLAERWQLVPATQSKFERALAFFDIEMPALKDSLLCRIEREQLQRVAYQENLYGRRARALLALDEGHTQGEAGAQAGMSERRVRHWLAEFRQKRLSIFPERTLREARAPRPHREPPEPTPGAVLQRLLHAPGSPSNLTLAEAPGVDRDDTLAEATRKIYLFHFQRLLRNEAGVRADEDVEAVHDMRVATRRVRTAGRVFADYVDRRRLRPFREELNRLADLLGGVRDLDVFWEGTEDYLAAEPRVQPEELAPLRRAWEEARLHTRRRLLNYLDSEAYWQFKAAFSEELLVPWTEVRTPLNRKGEAIPRRVRHVAPVLIYKRLARLRAFDEWIAEPGVPAARYHRLRIAGKHLRYTLEYFQEVLAPNVESVIRDLKALQDHLGALQDHVVALQLLRDFCTWGTLGPLGSSWAPRPSAAPGVTRYLEARQRALAEQRAGFPPLWQRFHSREFTE